MRKIGIFFPYLRESGICKVAANQSIMFHRAGYEVDLIVRDNDVIYPYAGNLVNLNIKPRKGFLKILTYIELFIKFKKHKSKKNYDIVLSHTPHCDFINVCISKNELTIATVHSDISKKYSRISQLILRYIAKKATHIVAVSKNTEQQMVEKFPEYTHKIQCIYNHLDLENIDKQAKEKSPLPINMRYILSVGRFSHEKGQWHLIKAFAKLSKIFPELRLVMIGSGKLEDDFKKLAKRLNISEKVLFEGFQSNPYKYMYSADLVVLPSLHEGFALVLIEAMACGTTVLATDCAGPREIIAPSKKISEILDYNGKFEYGFLVPNFANIDDLHNDSLSAGEELFVSKLEKILEKPELLKNYKNKNIERASFFSEEKALQKWIKLFQILEQENK